MNQKRCLVLKNKALKEQAELFRSSLKEIFADVCFFCFVLNDMYFTRVKQKQSKTTVLQFFFNVVLFRMNENSYLHLLDRLCSSCFDSDYVAFVKGLDESTLDSILDAIEKDDSLLQNISLINVLRNCIEFEKQYEPSYYLFVIFWYKIKRDRFQNSFYMAVCNKKLYFVDNNATKMLDLTHSKDFNIRFNGLRFQEEHLYEKSVRMGKENEVSYRFCSIVDLYFGLNLDAYITFVSTLRHCDPQFDAQHLMDERESFVLFFCK